MFSSHKICCPSFQGTSLSVLGPSHPLATLLVTIMQSYLLGCWPVCYPVLDHPVPCTPCRGWSCCHSTRHVVAGLDQARGRSQSCHCCHVELLLLPRAPDRSQSCHRTLQAGSLWWGPSPGHEVSSRPLVRSGCPACGTSATNEMASAFVWGTWKIREGAKAKQQIGARSTGQR